MYKTLYITEETANLNWCRISSINSIVHDVWYIYLHLAVISPWMGGFSKQIVATCRPICIEVFDQYRQRKEMVTWISRLFKITLTIGGGFNTTCFICSPTWRIFQLEMVQPPSSWQIALVVKRPPTSPLQPIPPTVTVGDFLTIPIGSMGLIYLPTFTMKINQI